MRATQTVLPYGLEVLADALHKEVHHKRFAQEQGRGALRVAPAYRTVSKPAVMVILAKERKAIYSCVGENLREMVAREESQRTLTE